MVRFVEIVLQDRARSETLKWDWFTHDDFFASLPQFSQFCWPQGIQNPLDSCILA